jgi:hypothetical protein
MQNRGRPAVVPFFRISKCQECYGLGGSEFKCGRYSAKHDIAITIHSIRLTEALFPYLPDYCGFKLQDDLFRMATNGARGTLPLEVWARRDTNSP